MTVKRPAADESYAYYFHVLQYAGPMSKGEFARLIGKKTSSVTGILTNMEERGYKVVEDDWGAISAMGQEAKA